MAHYLHAAILAIVIPLSLTGCPPASNVILILPGEWSLELTGAPGIDVRIILVADGTTQNPPVSAGMDNLAGTITWSQDAETGTFTMVQEFGGDTFTHTGTAYAITYMEGGWVTDSSIYGPGTWTASYVP